jgi:hypothetical protein
LGKWYLPGSQRQERVHCSTLGMLQWEVGGSICFGGMGVCAGWAGGGVQDDTPPVGHILREFSNSEEAVVEGM